MSAAVPFSPYSAALLSPPPERQRWLFVPTMSPIRCLSIHPSVISPPSLYPLVSLVCRCWKQVVKQAALSKWRQAPRSLQFCYWGRVTLASLVCLCECTRVALCVCVCLCVRLCVFWGCVTLASQSQVMISSPRWWLEAHKANYKHTHTHTLWEGKMGSWDWYCNGTLMGYLTSAFS